MLEIIPSPGTEDTDWAAIEKKIELLRPFIKTLHVDVADGKFVPNKTFMDPAPFRKYAGELLLEVHLMTENPLQYLKAFADAGFRRFIGQVEKMPDQVEFVAAGQLLGEVGLAVDGPTPVGSITVPLDDLDCLLFYTGQQAGRSGAVLVPQRLEKVKEVRTASATIPIEVDGGVSDTAILQMKEAGVSRFVTTGFVFNSENPREQFEKLKNLVAS
jgi:ribulose-phosphate 3-epimerase